MYLSQLRIYSNHSFLSNSIIAFWIIFALAALILLLSCYSIVRMCYKLIRLLLKEIYIASDLHNYKQNQEVIICRYTSKEIFVGLISCKRNHVQK